MSEFIAAGVLVAVQAIDDQIGRVVCCGVTENNVD